MKKLTIVALVLVLCLAAVGIGYAKWTDAINVSATVKTGNVDLNVVSYSGTWVWKVPSLQPCELVVSHDPEYVPEDPDAFLVASSEAKAGEAEDSVVMIWDNIFPLESDCFMADVVFQYQGTIPVKVAEINPVVTPADSPLLEYVTIQAYRTDETGKIGDPVVVGTQLHKGDMVKLVVSICNIPEEDAFMGLTLEASATIGVAQWSDAACKPE